MVVRDSIRVCSSACGPQRLTAYLLLFTIATEFLVLGFLTSAIVIDYHHRLSLCRK